VIPQFLFLQFSLKFHSGWKYFLDLWFIISGVLRKGWLLRKELQLLILLTQLLLLEFSSCLELLVYFFLQILLVITYYLVSPNWVKPLPFGWSTLNRVIFCIFPMFFYLLHLIRSIINWTPNLVCMTPQLLTNFTQLCTLGIYLQINKLSILFFSTRGIWDIDLDLFLDWGDIGYTLRFLDRRNLVVQFL
jgi:hypothetical protein